MTDSERITELERRLLAAEKAIEALTEAVAEGSSLDEADPLAAGYLRFRERADRVS